MLSVGVPTVQADDVGGLIDTDTTWNLAGSPYIVVDPVMVMEDVTLTIQPGVVVKFDSHKSLQIQGELIAIGTSDQPITFTYNSASPAAGDWDYIFFTDSSEDAVYDVAGNYVSGSILQHTVIEYAGGSTVENNAALRMDAAAPFITYTTVRHSASHGIRAFNLIDAHTLKLTHDTITNCNGMAIYETGTWDDFAGYAEISDSLIANNSSGDQAIVVLGGNFWDGIFGGTAVITNNVIRENDVNSEVVRITGMNDTTFSNNLITENAVFNCPQCWDKFSAAIYGPLGTVSGNLIFNNSMGGLMGQFHGYAANNLISDNRGRGINLVSAPYNSPITIAQNTILRNTAPNDAALIYNYAGTAVIESNTIVGNISTGDANLRAVYIAEGVPTFNHNNISGNTGYALYNDNPQTAANLNAENTWWGTIGSGNISALIYDWFDDSSKGIVDYSPYRAAWNPGAPISPPSGFSLTPETSSITLDWSPNPESDVAGYKVYYDTDAGYPYSGTGADQGDSPIDVGNVTNFSLSGLESGVIYHFAVTAYDTSKDGTNDWTDGNESWFTLDAESGIGLPPTAEFSATPTSGESPLLVDFTNESTGDFTACLWDFGDGNTSSNCNNPSHTYQTGGLYTVALTVAGPNGEDTRTRPDYINVTQAIQAGFIGAPTSGNVPLQVDFTNQSLGDYTTCAWDFGDSGTDNNCNNPSHTYTSAGVYTVTLTVNGAGGTNTQTRPSYISVYEPVQAGFTGSPTSGFVPLQVDFTNQSTGDYTTCAWDFGDGGTSSDCNDPTHIYLTGGVYTVTLTVSGGGGSDVEVKSGYITVKYGLYLPIVLRMYPSAASTHRVAPDLSG